MIRTLWQLRESQYAAGKYKPRAGWAPEHFRALSSSNFGGESIHFWHRVIASRLDRRRRLLIAVPLDQYWMESFRQPTPSELFVAGLAAALSLTCDQIAEPPSISGRGAGDFEQVASGEQTVATGREAGTGGPLVRPVIDQPVATGMEKERRIMKDARAVGSNPMCSGTAWP